MWMSAKQVEKAIRQGDEAHLCVIQLEINEGKNKCNIKDEHIKVLLAEFQDVIPSQLLP